MPFFTRDLQGFRLSIGARSEWKRLLCSGCVVTQGYVCTPNMRREPIEHSVNHGRVNAESPDITRVSAYTPQSLPPCRGTDPESRISQRQVFFEAGI